MISYQHKSSHNKETWYRYLGIDVIIPEELIQINFKIDGVVYTEWSAAFEHALLWEKLQAC